MNQKCFVTNKAQLLAAVGCALDFDGDTEITLTRKHGTTRVRFWCSHYGFTHNKLIKKVRAKIRRTSAECFR